MHTIFVPALLLTGIATPLSPPSGLRQGFYRQADPATGPFNGHHSKSKFLAL